MNISESDQDLKLKSIVLSSIVAQSNIYIVSYDLHRANPDEYEELADELKKYTGYHTLESFWFVKTHKTAQQVFDDLKKYIDPQDKLIVIQCMKGAEFAGNLEPKETIFL